jgi:6-pyruvoyltetrahydropterin/6-carboxytetrahydropterin synthase
LGRIEISKQAHNFSIAHFTIFSATERENLHGHNFQVECELTSPIADDGLIFDYHLIKRVVKELCDEIDELVVLPELSPYLLLEKGDEYLVAIYNNERLPFLYRDVVTLPIANSSVEELSHYFLGRILNHSEIAEQDIVEMTVKISSSPGQKGTATWVAN